MAAQSDTAVWLNLQYMNIKINAVCKIMNIFWN